MKQRPVQFRKPEDVNPTEIERLNRYNDEVNVELDAKISALETALSALTARVTTLEAAP